MDKVDILGVQIDNLSPQEVLEQVNHFLHSNDQHYLVTPNPEFIVATNQDHEFKEILNYADIAVADGVGLIKIAKLLGQRLQRVTGVDLVWLISELAEQQNCSVYLLGAAETVAAQTATVLKENLPNLIVAGAESGGDITDPKEIDHELIERINDSQAAILFVALGQIKQEKWIFYHLDQLPNIKVAVGIGGAFDYISGNVLRAPKILRNLGLEWLFRLILQPQRYKRIFTATVIFPWLVLIDQIKKRVAPNR
ncbi:MAG: WecB/TagA/CpsF family glycosyltransferase [Patescibacteria group bacterium]|jgi:N-acetylglucosaminyldiphosphoundecaprenol N-acetyl-beta-D-mannosaminyltransferase|nr:WecB/TagA/CpsF family glycosyltransferase [Patescibacteria group bacterium]